MVSCDLGAISFSLAGAFLSRVSRVFVFMEAQFMDWLARTPAQLLE